MTLTCPYCESDQVALPEDFDGREAEAECLDCGHTWLVGEEDI